MMWTSVKIANKQDAQVYDIKGPKTVYSILPGRGLNVQIYGQAGEFPILEEAAISLIDYKLDVSIYNGDVLVKQFEGKILKYILEDDGLFEERIFLGLFN